MISETGMECFHWDTKLGNSASARTLAGERISLMGGINNPELLRLADEEQILQKCREAVEDGIDIVAPECAVPLDTPMKNLKTLGASIVGLRQGG